MDPDSQAEFEAGEFDDLPARPQRTSRQFHRGSCGHTNTKVERVVNSVHYGKEVCNDCGAFVRWVSGPKPGIGTLRLPQFDVIPPLATLKGSERQVQWAKSLREEMLTRFSARAQSDEAFRPLYWAVRSLEDAGWWIANRNQASLETFSWPRTWWPEGAPTAPTDGPVPQARRAAARPPAQEIVEDGPPPSVRPAPRSAAPKVIEEKRSGFSVDINLSGGLHVVAVTFDGRSGGVLRMTTEELRQFRTALDMHLKAHE